MIGLSLIDECINNQTYVIAILRKGSKKRHLIPDSKLVSVYECDLSKLGELDIMEGFGSDAFFHFAWSNTDKEGRKNAQLQEQNIGTTLDSLKLAHRLKCNRFIGAGSQAEYGRHEGLISPKMAVSPDSAYGIAKYAAGKLASILSTELSIPFIWTRIFSVFGPNDLPSTMIMHCIHELLQQKRPALTKCEQMWDYLYCGDAAKIFYLLGTKGTDQSIYNIGSGYSRPLSEYVSIIKDTIDRDLPLGIGDLDYTENQVMSLCPDISNLIQDTGFRPGDTFADGIINTINWYKDKVME